MVYVDSMRAKFGRMIMCHMIADTADELHAMAAAIGINPKHYQGDHYDICLAKRKMAVERGAKEVSTREIVLARRRLWKDQRDSYLRRVGETE